jgi:hypothetical protein
MKKIVISVLFVFLAVFFPGQAMASDIIRFLPDGGYYNSSANSGQYGGAEIRYLHDLGGKYFGKKFFVGAFVAGSIGSGESGDSDYNWSKVAVGPAVQYNDRGWNEILKIGYRYLNSGSDNGPSYKASQTDHGVYASSTSTWYGNRLAGLSWLPENELWLGLEVALSQDQERSWKGKTLVDDPENNDSYSGKFTQYFYNFGSANDVMVGAYVGGEYRSEKSYFEAGPTIRCRYNGLELNISAGWKDQTDGDDDRFAISGGVNYLY